MCCETHIDYNLKLWNIKLMLIKTIVIFRWDKNTHPIQSYIYDKELIFRVWNSVGASCSAFFIMKGNSTINLLGWK